MWHAVSKPDGNGLLATTFDPLDGYFAGTISTLRINFTTFISSSLAAVYANREWFTILPAQSTDQINDPNDSQTVPNGCVPQSTDQINDPNECVTILLGSID